MVDALNMISSTYYLHIQHRVAVRCPGATHRRGGSAPNVKNDTLFPLVRPDAHVGTQSQQCHAGNGLTRRGHKVRQ